MDPAGADVTGLSNTSRRACAFDMMMGRASHSADVTPPRDTLSQRRFASAGRGGGTVVKSYREFGIGADKKTPREGAFFEADKL